MAVTQYIGARYVPIFADPIEWSSTKQYEPLTIVTHEGNSYTSRQFVPVGIDILNETYWALTGNYDAQVEQYRQETNQVSERYDEIADSLPLNAFGTETVADKIGNLAALLPSNAFSDNTVKEYIDSKFPFGIIQNTADCGLLASPSLFPDTDETTSYVEDFAVDNLGLFYIVTSVGDLIVTNSEFEVLNRKSLTDQTLGCICFNPRTRKLYTCNGTVVLVINPTSLLVESTLSLPYFMCFDMKTEKFLGFNLRNGVLELVEFNDNVEIISSETTNIGDNLYSSNSCECYDNCLITCNFNEIIQIDIVTKQVKLLKLEGELQGALEIEGFCYYDDMMILAQICDYGIPTKKKNVRIYKNNLSNQQNMNSEYPNNATWQLRGGIGIAQNTDLNTLTANGNYFGTNAQSLLNSPVTVPFLMKVFNAYGTGSTKIQELICSDAPYSVYRRHVNASSGATTPWVKTTIDDGNDISLCQLIGYNIRPQEEYVYQLKSQLGALITKREVNQGAIYLFDIWTAGYTVIGTPSGRLTITKEAGSREIRITNTAGGQTPIIIIG